MRNRIRSTAYLAAIVAASCTASDPEVGGRSQASAMPAVRISEFHYDNFGTDVNENIEVSGPAGMDVTGWKVYLYNGNGGAFYAPTITMSGTIPATCGTRGVMVFPAAGLQNGSPDGIALVDPNNAVVEFLSYEGTFAATNGPASGMTAVDIGVQETAPSSDPNDLSLQRTGTGSWTGPVKNTFGTCNDSEPPPPAPIASVSVSPASATIEQGGTKQLTATAYDDTNQPIAGTTFNWTTSDPNVAMVDTSGLVSGAGLGDVTITATAGGFSASSAIHVEAPAPPPPPPDTRISELHYDNFGNDENEAVEIEGPAGTDLTGWSIVLYNGDPASRAPYNTRVLSGAIPDTCGGRGVVVAFYPANGIQNGAPDGLALVDAGGALVELLSYEGSFSASSGPAAGTTAKDIGVSQTSATPGTTLQRDVTGVTWASGLSTLGLCNGATPPAPSAKRISFSGRSTADPDLPVGFQDQLFATELDPNAVATTFTWSSESPAVASIDEDGVVTALAAGTAVVRATAADGTSATYALATRVAQASITAVYQGNAEFGEPTDADPNDDFIVRHPEYTVSYNPVRNTPNWVAYEEELTHYGPEDRCDCFTFDPALPEWFFHYTTADYTGAGAVAGYGIDRGHLARSFDRTSASLDNAFTFYLSNIVPQAADLNQGPWAAMETELGDLARFSNKEVYIIAGVAGNIGTVKNEGHIVIPASTWKVAVIMPRDKGLADVHDYRDLEVIAVVMPNIPGIRNVPWRNFATTVDAIEELTGYDLLAALDDKTEAAVEANVRPPFARIDGPYASAEGSAVTMSAAASFDPNGPVVAYAWDFGDGTTGSGAEVTHTYAQDGEYPVTVTVTDEDGLTDSASTTASVANVAPEIADFAGASGLLPGESYAASGSFTDPGDDAWTGSVDYGDGTGEGPLAVSGRTFALAHTYELAGTFTVTVRVADDDSQDVATQAVEVLTLHQALVDARDLLDGLVADGLLAASSGSALRAKLNAAIKYVDQGNRVAAIDVLLSFVSQVDALVRTGRLDHDAAEPVRTLVKRVLRSLAR